MAFGSDRGHFTEVKRSVVDKNLGPLMKTLPRWLIKLKPEEIVGVAGQLSDAESMMTLKDFLNKMGSNNVWCEANGSNRDANLRSGYILNSTIAGLEKADAFLLIGTQPRVEAVIVNAKIRKTVQANHAKVGYVGPPADFNYNLKQGIQFAVTT
ncbi:hypothetical protein PS1_013134 [Malus domestica]